jgi:flavin-dependent dehydrogenase
VIDDATVTAVDGGVVRFSRADREEEARARWVLDCSGRSGVVARRGWRRPLPAQRTLAIVGVWERLGDWPVEDPTHTIVESHSEGWAWSVPASRNERHVTVMVDPRVTDLRAHNALADSYQAELRRVPGLGHLTRGARLVGAPFARDASPYAAHQVAEQGTLLIGDAASFVDPLSSYGIKKALASAWLASVVVNTALCDASMERTAIELHESRERAIYAALERQRAALAQAALAADATSDFWASRVDADVSDGVEPNEEPNVAALRDDPAVRAAFDEIRRRESIELRIGPRLQRVREAAVLENRVVLEPRLRLAGSERAIRFVRNVDLVALADSAPDVSQVPDLYEVYCQRHAPVPLPDFLGALAFLIARGFLEFA